MAAPLLDVAKLFSLAGKTAIVTGGTGGLGTAMTVALASAGADIISIEIHQDPASKALAEAISKTGRQLRQYECDMRSSSELRAVYQKIWADGNTADILLNCAGILRRSPAIDFTDDDIDVVLAVNLKATVVSCQEFAKPLLAAGRPGKIINISSVASFVAGQNIMPYAASKGAVLQATKAFSNEWAEKGIQCNCIHPGWFLTPMTRDFTLDPRFKEIVEANAMARTPAKRWGVPEDLSGTAIFLASSASNYVTGASIVCDGGFMAM